MDSNQIRKMSDEEIRGTLSTTRGRLFQRRTQTVTEKVEDTSEIGKLRKDVARLMTEMNRRRHERAGAGAAKN
jgi:ribosomal protein L29